ncbi:glycosyltransferase [Salinimicrobium oceani]|uniref:Glycosyltransferase n=1 Tax=Salinimicrobium oceani TaxID=2722702 RepID=A0ABX1CYU9_9FLAO|nr:glycosyltransferase [Salinimicrobium oceani]NJW53442.1 glycosyltransferase [Salinimicrobium oceani]
MNKKMTVLFLIDGLGLGGAETSITEITSRFSKVKPVIIHLHDIIDHKPYLVQNGIQVYSLNIRDKKDIKGTLDKIRPIVVEVQPSIIHSTLHWSDHLARLLKKEFNNIKLINSFVSNTYGKDRYRRMSFLRRLKLKWVELKDKNSAPIVDLFISNSKSIKKDNIKALGIPEEKVVVIPRGRNTVLYDIPEKESEDFKREMGVQGKDIILNVGRLIKTKAQLDLIRGFSKVAPQYPDTVLWLVGEGDCQELLEEEIKNLKITDRVLLLGQRTDIPLLLSVAKIFVFPSHLEGMPGALIEAMMAGKLIISSDIPENRECLPSDCGLFYKTGNTGGLANQMVSALDNFERLQDKAERARDFATQNYDLSKISSLHESVYFDLIKDNNSIIKELI